MDEDLYNFTSKKLRLEKLAAQFIAPNQEKKKKFVVQDEEKEGEEQEEAYIPLQPEQFKEDIEKFSKYHVIKMSRVF